MISAANSLGSPYSEAARAGLQALKSQHRTPIDCHDPRRLTGSIDLDGTLRTDGVHGKQSRWDYGVGFTSARDSRRCVAWVEVHSANPGAVTEMEKKLAWLKAWINDMGSDFMGMTRAAQSEFGYAPYFWVSTGPVTISKTSPSARKLASLGIRRPVRKVEIP